VIPRLLLIWMTGEVVRTREQRLLLGHRVSQFMAELGMKPTGGDRGTIGALRDQMKRLFKSTIDLSYRDHEQDFGPGFKTSRDYQLGWKKKDAKQGSEELAIQSDLWNSWVELTEDFYLQLRDHSLPVDLRRIKMVRRLPLALDIYTWLTYRFSYLRKPSLIPLQGLYEQFGSDYATVRQFKYEFSFALQKAHKAYPEANLEFDKKKGLLLKPSRTSVRKLPAPVAPAARIASKESADLWAERNPGKFKRFIGELSRIREARVGVQIPDVNQNRINIARLAAERADIPIDIAYKLVGLETLNSCGGHS